MTAVALLVLATAIGLALSIGSAGHHQPAVALPASGPKGGALGRAAIRQRVWGGWPITSDLPPGLQAMLHNGAVGGVVLSPTAGQSVRRLGYLAARLAATPRAPGVGRPTIAIHLPRTVWSIFTNPTARDLARVFLGPLRNGAVSAVVMPDPGSGPTQVTAVKELVVAAHADGIRLIVATVPARIAWARAAGVGAVIVSARALSRSGARHGQRRRGMAVICSVGGHAPRAELGQALASGCDAALFGRGGDAIAATANLPGGALSAIAAAPGPRRRLARLVGIRPA